MLSEDIINYDFPRAFKGYAVEQVDEYIDALIAMYQQLSSENEELSRRVAELDSQLKEKQETVDTANEVIAERDRIVADAAETAQKELYESKQKAHEYMVNAENTARRLLEEAKSRAESIGREAEDVKAAADEAAKKTASDAMEEAKKLIKVTKLNCVKRLCECDERVAEAQREYDALIKKAADFKAMLFEQYSSQILSIENLEVPEPAVKTQEKASSVHTVTHTEELSHNENVLGDTDGDGGDKNALEHTDGDDADKSAPEHSAENADVGDEARLGMTAQAAQQSAEEDEPTAPDTVDNSPFDGADCTVKTEDESTPEQSAPPIDGEAELREALLGGCEKTETQSANVQPAAQTYLEKSGEHGRPKRGSEYAKSTSYTGFAVETEHSGQVHYDSTNIRSVNKKLDDIIRGKGKENTTGENKGASMTRKFDFLK